MQDLNMVESVIKDLNIKRENSEIKELNNIFLKNKKIIRVKLKAKTPSFEKKNPVFGARKKRKLFLSWPRDIFYDSR